MCKGNQKVISWEYVGFESPIVMVMHIATTVSNVLAAKRRLHETTGAYKGLSGGGFNLQLS